MGMPLVLVSSPRFVDHVTPAGHPERPERAETLGQQTARLQRVFGRQHVGQATPGLTTDRLGDGPQVRADEATEPPRVTGSLPGAAAGGEPLAPESEPAPPDELQVPAV